MKHRHRSQRDKSKPSTSVMTHSALQTKKDKSASDKAPPSTAKSLGLSNFNFSNISVQPKLTVGQSNDKYEQEADQVADRVVQQINSPQKQNVQKKQSSQASFSPKIPSEGESLQTKPSLQRMGHEGGDVSDEMESEIQRARGRGTSLAPQLQTKMGNAMGADFSGVRIHTDHQSDQLNRAIQAKAFTTGKDVFFRQGEYNPSSRSGQQLIAHELTHVVQQNSGVQRKLNPKGAHEGANAISKSANSIVQRDDEEEDKKKKKKEIDPGVSIGTVDVTDFTDKSEQIIVGGSRPDMFDAPETIEKTENNVSTGRVTNTETTQTKFEGCGMAMRVLTEADDLTVKQAFQALARAGAFGETIAKKEIETSSGTKVTNETKKSHSVGLEGEVVSKKVRDAMNGLTILARATAQVGLKFELSDILEVATQVGDTKLTAKLSTKLAGFAGMMTEAKGKFNINAYGLALEGKVYGMVGVESQGEISVELKAGELGFDGKGIVSGFAGASVGLEGKLSIGLEGISASGKMEAFAGTKVKSSYASSLTYRGTILIKLSGELEASAGVGGEIAGEFTIKDGKLIIGGKLSASLGLGGGSGAKVEIDFKAIAQAIYARIEGGVQKKVLDNRSTPDEDRKTEEDLDQNQKQDIEKQLYDAIFPHLSAYGRKKLNGTKTFSSKKYDHLVKRERVQEIIDKKIRKQPKLDNYLDYKFTDAVLQKACLDAFGDQLTPESLYIQKGVIRAFGVKKREDL